MKIKKENGLSVDDVQSMSYTDFIAFIKESNRCPGGKDTIRTIAKNALLSEKSKVLDVGSNTGFNTFEFAHITQAKIYGIDISKECVKESKERLVIDTKDIKRRVSFQVGSAYKIPFKNNMFDLVMCGGATSFMEDKNKAVNEYFRVIKPWGKLAATQLFYSKRPPQKMLDAVSKLIGVKIIYLNDQDWLKIFRANNNYELYYFRKFKFLERSDKDLKNYVKKFLNKPHIKGLSTEMKDEILKKWYGYMKVFNDNMKFLSFFIAIFRKNIFPEEEEFFIKNNV